jgi:hypothetical protein
MLDKGAELFLGFGITSLERLDAPDILRRSRQESGLSECPVHIHS